MIWMSQSCPKICIKRVQIASFSYTCWACYMIFAIAENMKPISRVFFLFPYLSSGWHERSMTLHLDHQTSIQYPKPCEYTWANSDSALPWIVAD